MSKILFVAVFFMSTQVFAQHAPQNKRSNGGRIQSTAYGALTTVYSKFNGENALFTGG